MKTPTQIHKTTLETTGDGSTTLFSEPFQQPYHNRAGAASESGYLFLDMTGLRGTQNLSNQSEKNPLYVLEIGFGTGLNMALLHETLSNRPHPPLCHYYSVEGFPPDPSLINQMEYGMAGDSDPVSETIRNTLQHATTGWNDVEMDASFQLHLLISRFEAFAADRSLSDSIPPIDLFFHDPFSPETNPEGWTPELFRRLRHLASEDALLSTYSASSRARAAMADAGWYVARAPGALNKREMTLASPNPDCLRRWKRVNESRLAQRLRDGDFQML